MILAGALAFTGCGKDDETPYQRDLKQASWRLSALNSCDDIDDYLVDVNTESYIGQFRSYNSIPVDAPEAIPGDSDGQAPGPSAPDDYTETNTQEEGVDESDLVKTDGNYVYVAQNNLLKILKSWPAEETEVVAELDLSGFTQELYLQEDRLIVISREVRTYGCGAQWDVPCDGNSPFDWNYGNGGLFTTVEVYDVSTPEAPALERSFEIGGDLVTSRTVDGIIYLVANRYYPLTWDLYERITDELFGLTMESRGDYWNVYHRVVTEDLYNRVHDLAEELVGSGVARKLLTPTIAVNGGERKDAVSCDELYAPDGLSGDIASTSIIAIDPSSDELPASTGILASGWTVYGSKDAIYISRPSNTWNFNVYQREARTDIHRFTLNDGEPRYAASGTVPGFQYDRFGFSERDGYLRVATTDASNWWWGDGDVVGVPAPIARQAQALSPVAPPPQANNLFVIEQHGDELETVGEVRGFGVNESIYGIRYVGDMAYVVTFRRTDPLYAIDLSNPENPAIQGELKIPGFSDFLQSIGDDLLLGVGMDADLNGWATGFQVQLFDVSNPEEPIRTSQLVFPFGNGWSNSIAQHESRAFTWYASRELLAIPFSSYTYSTDWNIADVFNGALVMKVTRDNGIVELGRISHSHFLTAICDEQKALREGENDADEDDAVDPEGDASEPYPGGYTDYWCSPDWAMWSVQYLRTVFIGDYVFGLSTVGLTVSQLTDDGISEPLISIRLD